MPNPKLKWEQKKDYNIGFDMRIAKLSLTFDYYSADTKKHVDQCIYTHFYRLRYSERQLRLSTQFWSRNQSELYCVAK